MIIQKKNWKVDVQVLEEVYKEQAPLSADCWDDSEKQRDSRKSSKPQVKVWYYYDIGDMTYMWDIPYVRRCVPPGSVCDINE